MTCYSQATGVGHFVAAGKSLENLSPAERMSRVFRPSPGSGRGMRQPPVLLSDSIWAAALRDPLLDFRHTIEAMPHGAIGGGRARFCPIIGNVQKRGVGKD